MSTGDYRYVRSFFTVSQIRRGLGITVLAASLGAVFYTQAVPVSILFAGFALELKVSNPQMSVLVAMLPLASLFEIVMAYLIHRTGKRQEFFTWGLILSRLLWLPIIMIPYYIGPESHAFRIALMCILLFLSSVISVAGGNAWGTWMGDLVPGTVLGRYFGFRQIFTVLTSLIAGVLVGQYLDIHHGVDGFVVMICVLLAFGIADVALFRWVPHPPMRRREERRTLLEMLRVPLSDRRYRRVILIFAVWNLTANMVGPYVGFFLLGKNYAGMSFTEANIYSAIGGLCLVVTSYYWGRLADRWNPKKVLVICISMASVTALLYLIVTPERTWPVLVAMIMGNIGWGGVFVVNVQLVIRMAPAKERSMYLASQSAIMGVILTASYLAGGFIVKLLENVQWSVGPYVWRDLHILFLITGLLRFATLIPLRYLPDKKSGSDASASPATQPAP